MIGVCWLVFAGCCLLVGWLVVSCWLVSLCFLPMYLVCCATTAMCYLMCDVGCRRWHFLFAVCCCVRIGVGVAVCRCVVSL